MSLVRQRVLSKRLNKKRHRQNEPFITDGSRLPTGYQTKRADRADKLTAYKLQQSELRIRKLEEKLNVQNGTNSQELPKQ